LEVGSGRLSLYLYITIILVILSRGIPKKVIINISSVKTNTMVLKNRVKEFTENKGITIYKFAKDVGISFNTGYRLSNDPTHLPSITVLEMICDRYGVQPGEIVELVK